DICLFLPLGCGCMLSHKVLALILVLLIVYPLFFFEIAVAEDEIKSIVDASLDVEFETATDLKVSVTMDVNEVTVFDTTYTNNEIHNLASSANISDLETMGAIKLKLRDLLKNQIKKSFENATVTALNEKPSYQNTQFYDDYSVNLTAAFFGLDETVNAYDFVNGVLDMDAIVYYAFSLQAEPGWNNTYAVTLPDSMKYRYTTGAIYVNRILWEVKNRDGQNPESLAELSIQFVEPSTPGTSEDDIYLEFELDTSNINQIALQTTIAAKTVDIREYDVLPDLITELDFVPSDGMRLFIDNGFFSWEDLYNKTIKTIEKLIISTIENSSLNQTMEMSFHWNPETTINCSSPYNITSMDDNPPIKAELTDEDIRLLICDIPTRAFFGLINAGAKANISADDIKFGDKLDEIKRPYDVFLRLPNNITLEGKNIYSWNQSTPISGEFASDAPLEYPKEDIETYIEIEIRKMDLDLPSFFTGKTKLTATSHAKEDTYIRVMHFPAEFNISGKINLTYLNSDAFRLCTEENVFTTADINVYLTNKKVVFNTRLYDVLNNLEMQGAVNKDVFYDSLKWDGDIANMDNVNPVKISIYANNIYSIDFNLSFWPPGITVSNQTFSLKSLENRPVTYCIIFPKGISVDAKDTLNKSMIQGETSDGREYIELSFEADDSVETNVVVCKLSTSSFYLLGLFLPCLLSLLLVIILIIIVYLIRKKKKGRKIIHEEVTGYEDQDYYVPPPPQSK
ncbi:MAG: hypothetical protein JSW60_06130, partial [Thermoplasmatales archaeon]